MIFGIQVLGILFGLVMLFLTYNNYKRKQYTKEAYVLWLLVWFGVIFVFSLPKLFYGIMEGLQITRTAEFFTALALIFLTALAFHMYSIVKNTERRMEELVRNIAFEKSNSKREKK